MILNLHPAGRENTLVLYDPEALPSDLDLDPDLEAQEPEKPSNDSVKRLTESGQSLVIHVLSNPDYESAFKLRVYVDETVPGKLREKSDPESALTKSLLHVPGGSLVADGVEFMTFPGEVREEAVSGEASIPPGTYQLQAFELYSWKEENYSSEVIDRISPLSRFLGKFALYSGCLCGILAVLSIIGAFVVGGVLASSDKAWSTVFTVTGSLAGVSVITYLVFILATWAIEKFPILNAESKARKEFESEYPDVVIGLTREEESGLVPDHPAVLNVRV